MYPNGSPFTVIIPSSAVKTSSPGTALFSTTNCQSDKSLPLNFFQIVVYRRRWKVPKEELLSGFFLHDCVYIRLSE